MAVLGWILVVLGIASYVVALAMLIKEQFLAKREKALPVFEDMNFKAIGDLLDKAGNAIEKFAKLSVPVQWALLGLANIVAGVYLINL